MFRVDKIRQLISKWSYLHLIVKLVVLLRKGGWKLSNTDEQWGKGRPSAFYIKPVSNDNSLKLFNVEEDPGERNDLADLHPEKVAELKLDYENWCRDNLGNF